MICLIAIDHDIYSFQETRQEQTSDIEIWEWEWMA